MRRRMVVYAVVIPVMFGLTLGCGQAKKKQEQQQSQLQKQSLAITKSYEALVNARKKVADEKATLEQLKQIRKRKLTDEQKQQLAQLPEQIKADEQDVSKKYDEVQDKLATFLNFALNNAPKAPQTAAALKIYSDEAINNAETAIREAGDYKKAIEILQTAVGYYESAGLTPYKLLKQKMTLYDQMQFITKDRFDAVKKGMSEEEVSKTAGYPYYMNKKHEKGVDFWLYPRRDGGAAAIYFNRHHKVYSKRWNAVKPKVKKD
ncbi:MAG: hypothetical protein GXP48_01840 [Acidobacteria bacterium]|nr:hypothetical protein [Acidobacteriota bacterium]